MEWMSLLRWAVPYLVICGLGFAAAWTVQGARIGELKNDVRAEAQKLTDYKQKQEQARLEAEAAAEQRRKETANEWAKKLAELEGDHETYRRCVAAGKCGARIVRVPNLPDGSDLRISPPGGANAAGADAVPAAGEVAAEDGILKDCARTTLQLNQLQADIEKQYK